MTAALGGSPAAVESPALATLRVRIESLIEGQTAVYGIAFQYLGEGDTLLINENDRMHAASTMKVPVMMRIFAMVDKGQITLGTPVTVHNAFRSIVDGSTYEITVDSDEALYQLMGQQVSVGRLVDLMITRSSNLATNLLVALADAAETTRLMREIGAREVLVRRGVEDLKAFEKNLNNECSAGDMLRIMVACVSSPRFSPTSRQDMLAVLRKQTFKDIIPAGIPDERAVVANKTGSISRVEHDAAIVDLPGGVRYVLVIFARDFGEERERVQTTGRQISRLVYDYVRSRSY